MKKQLLITNPKAILSIAVVLLSTILFFSFQNQNQSMLNFNTGDYEAEWRTIDSLERQGLPKSASRCGVRRKSSPTHPWKHELITLFKVEEQLLAIPATLTRSRIFFKVISPHLTFDRSLSGDNFSVEGRKRFTVLMSQPRGKLSMTCCSTPLHLAVLLGCQEKKVKHLVETTDR